MRLRPSLLSLFGSVTPLLLAAGCTGQSSAAPPSDDGGTEGGGPAYVYTPAGCSYSFEPQANLGFIDIAPNDDSAAVTSNDGTPVRVRLGLGGGVTKGKAGYADPATTAAFTWETNAVSYAAKVKLGTSMTALTTVQAGYSWSTPGKLGPANYMHEVHVCGLQPNTTYYYQVGGGAGAGIWSATQSFTTMPSSGTITVGVFGDARDNSNIWQTVHERMREKAVGMMLIPGDIVDIGANEQLYQTWLDAIWKDPNDSSKFLTLGQQMMVPINGNHENDSADSFANWSIPADQADPYPETYASFDVGPVHFILIDDEQISTLASGTNPEASAQLAWIDSDLKAANADRANHPFIVALSHRGMFSTSNHAADGDVIATRGQLAPLYDKYKVDLAINGHDHEYERSKPVTAGNPPTGMPVVGPPGTVYVINAGAGADPYAINTSPQPYSSGVQVCLKTASGCTNSYVGLYSFLQATTTALTLTEYAFTTSSTSISEDTVIDTVTLSAQ